jgi:hypothetical protein
MKRRWRDCLDSEGEVIGAVYDAWESVAVGNKRAIKSRRRRLMECIDWRAWRTDQLIPPILHGTTCRYPFEYRYYASISLALPLNRLP